MKFPKINNKKTNVCTIIWLIFCYNIAIVRIIVELYQKLIACKWVMNFQSKLNEPDFILNYRKTDRTAQNNIGNNK